jgi:periplasmic protein CpxP/Spy
MIYELKQIDMKKIIITSTLLLCAVMGFSQQAPATAPKLPTAEQIAQREANALSQRLSLTEEQRSKAYNIYLEKAKKDIAAREALMKEMQKQRDLAAAERKQQDEKINQLLNAEQKKAYQDMQAQRNRFRGPGGSGMRQGPPQQGFQRGPRDQFRGQRNQGPGRFQRPGGGFQGPGAPNSRFQGGQPQRPNMPLPPNFRGRGQNFGQGGPGQNLRPQLRQRFEERRIRNRGLRLQRPDIETSAARRGVKRSQQSTSSG